MSSESSDQQNADRLPGEIHISLVSSLYGDPRNLMIGGAGTIGACLITAVKLGDVLFFGCAILLALVTLVRAHEMSAFKRRPSLSLDLQTARKWEIRYVVGSSLYVLIMGIWCFLAFARTNDPMVQLLAFSLVLVNIIGIAGRNFGSKLLVTTQLLCAGIPLLGALIWTSDDYYYMCACVLAPFFLSFSTIADRLRSTLTEAVVAAQDVRLLADRLDTALNNMGTGLCMIDRRGRIAVSNQRLPQLLGVAPDAFRAGRQASTAFLACCRNGLLRKSDIRQVLLDLKAQIAGPRPSLLLDVSGDRILAVTSRGMDDGSSVMVVEDVTEQKNAEARISRLAHFDGLTGLPNRVSFKEIISETLAKVRDGGSTVAVLFIDLDEFKQVNDTLGHSSGDQLLRLVSARLKDLAEDGCVISRLGGDEFVIIQSTGGCVADASTLARRVVAALSEPYDVEGHVVIIGASIGIALAPEDGTDADTLLKNADMALYQAKGDGRGRYCFFEPEMHSRAQERRALELDLRNALPRGELQVYYQPLVDLRTRRIAACEALLRWDHPRKGLVPPSDFIPLLEEMGLILDVGRWVLQEACREAATWPADTRVAVNLSPLQFRQSGLVDAVASALAESRLAPTRLDLEITESSLLRDTESVLDTLSQLRQMHVEISLDDFGTGYSSLSYIRIFALDAVKIDRSFLNNIQDAKQQTLLTGIAKLCNELGMRVVVEGVETFEQLDLVIANSHVREVQGFLFSKPAPAKQIRELLNMGMASGFRTSETPLVHTFGGARACLEQQARR